MHFIPYIKKLSRNFLKRSYGLSRETRLLCFFGFLLCCILSKLTFLQIIQGSYFQQLLIDQHFTKSSLQAERGNIYVKDRSDKSMKLTENLNLYNLYVDPNFIPDKTLFISLFAPIIYEHYCVQFEMQTPSKLECVQGIEKFTKQDLLPKKQIFFYGGELWGSGGYSTGLLTQYELDQEYQTKVQEIVDNFSQEKAITMISQALDEMIYTGIRKRNYLGYFENLEFIKALQQSGNNYISVEDNYYVYINPTVVVNARKEKEFIIQINEQYKQSLTSYQIQRAFQPQRVNYIKIISSMNGELAGRVKQLKKDYSTNKISNIPVFHGVGLEEFKKRYYPYGDFMSNILGFVNVKGEGNYGIEEYFQDIIAGKDGKIVGLSTPFIGQVGSNAVEIEQPKEGLDVFLTIDPVIQKELERMAIASTSEFRADGIAVTIMDPYSGKIIAMVNTPLYDPNKYDIAYKLKPVTVAEKEFIENDSYYEHPVLYSQSGALLFANEEERKNPQLQKYVFTNGFGSLVFLNRNISLPYEPGSIFKPISVSIGIDSNAIDLYDYYNDPGEVQVGDFYISNVSAACNGTHTFSHALAFSCNVGMVRVAQAMSKYVFYNYLERLGFTKKTGVELAREDSSYVPNMQQDSIAGFYNNTFGQGLLTTPLQIATVFSALVNGGTLVQPTIVDKIYDPTEGNYLPLAKKVKTKIFATDTSENIKDALVDVVRYGSIDKIKNKGFGLGAKSGTPEIAYRGRYRGTVGRTNGSAVGMITRNDTKYIVVVQVRRPRSSKRGNDTAVKLFDDLAGFLIDYESLY